ncbi:MAG: hypothetical protein ACK5M9_11695, partial [Mycobacterium sp.]
MRAEDLSKTLDLTVLHPGTAAEDVEAACDRATEFHFAALCSNPRFVGDIADRLRGTDIKACAAIGYPDG